MPYLPKIALSLAVVIHLCHSASAQPELSCCPPPSSRIWETREPIVELETLNDLDVLSGWKQQYESDLKAAAARGRDGERQKYATFLAVIDKRVEIISRLRSQGPEVAVRSAARDAVCSNFFFKLEKLYAPGYPSPTLNVLFVAANAHLAQGLGQRSLSKFKYAGVSIHVASTAMGRAVSKGYSLAMALSHDAGGNLVDDAFADPGSALSEQVARCNVIGSDE